MIQIKQTHTQKKSVGNWIWILKFCQPQDEPTPAEVNTIIFKNIQQKSIQSYSQTSSRSQYNHIQKHPAEVNTIIFKNILWTPCCCFYVSSTPQGHLGTNHTLTVYSTPRRKASRQKTSQKLAHSSMYNTINSKHNQAQTTSKDKSKARSQFYVQYNQ